MQSKQRAALRSFPQKPLNQLFDQVQIFTFQLFNNDIETVEEIEFKLRVHDDEDWFADDFVNEFFTFVPAQ